MLKKLALITTGILLFNMSAESATNNLSNYKFKYLTQQPEQNQAYQNFKLYVSYLKLVRQKKIKQALKVLDQLQGKEAPLKNYLTDASGSLMRDYLSTVESIKFLGGQGEALRAEAYPWLYSKVYSGLINQRLSMNDFKSFTQLYPDMPQQAQEKLAAFLFKGERLENHLKKLWIEDNLPESKKNYPYSSKDIQAIMDSASGNEWMKHFIKKFEHRSYVYLASTMGKYADKVAFGPEEKSADFYEIYIRSLAAIRKTTQMEAVLASIDSSALFRLRSDLMIAVMSAYLRNELYDKAEQLIKVAEEIGVDKHMQHRLKYESGRFLFKNDSKVAEAEKYFSEVDIDNLQDEDAEDFIWYISQLELNKESRAKAVSLLLGDAEKTGNNSYDSGFCYWRKKLRHTEGIFLENQNCAKEYTNYYYGIKSVMFNDKTEVFSEKCADESFDQYIEPGDDLYLEWASFLSHIQGQSAVNELMMKLDRKMSLYFLNRVSTDLTLQEDFFTQQNILVKHFSSWWDNKSWPAFVHNCGFFYQLAYPMAFEKSVKAIVVDYSIPFYLPFAIMREESHFNEKAVSVAGARGLMQLMPKTTRDVARRMKIQYSYNNLFDRDYNLKFGIYYFNHLYKRFDNNVVHALASYNGGPTNLKRWVKRNATSDSDIFVELIPYTETRNYVKKVLRSYYIYQTLHGKR